MLSSPDQGRAYRDVFIRIGLHHLPSHTFRCINLCLKPHIFLSIPTHSLVPGRQREGNLEKDYNPFQLCWWIEFHRKTTQNLFLSLWPNQPSHQIGTSPGPQLIEFAQRQTLVLHIRMRQEECSMKRIDWVVVSDYFCTDSGGAVLVKRSCEMEDIQLFWLALIQSERKIIRSLHLPTNGRDERKDGWITVSKWSPGIDHRIKGSVIEFRPSTFIRIEC